MDFPQLAQQYGIALAALTVVGIALGLVARALFAELKSRISRAEAQVDTLIPAMNRLSDAIEASTAVTSKVLAAMLQREKQG